MKTFAFEEKVEYRPDNDTNAWAKGTYMYRAKMKGWHWVKSATSVSGFMPNHLVPARRIRKVEK